MLTYNPELLQLIWSSSFETRPPVYLSIDDQLEIMRSRGKRVHKPI